MSGRPWLAGVFVPVVLLSGACGDGAGKTAVTPGVSGDTIYVGALMPLSDPVAVIGRPMLRGQQLYFDRVNAAGGIGGRYQVKVLEEDITYANPSTSVQKYQKLKDQVAAFTMVLGTDHVNGILPLLGEDGVVAVPVTLDAQWVRTPNLLPVWVPYQVQMANGVSYWLGLPGNADKTVCSMVLATGYGEAAEQGLDHTAAVMGFTVSAKVRFRQDDQDFVAPITQLRNANCEAVVLASLPAVTGKLLGAAAQLGWAPRWIMTSPSWHGAIASSPLGDYLAKTAWVVAEGPLWGDTTVAGMKELIDAIAGGAPDQVPDYYFVSGWVGAASTAALLETAVKAGDLSRAGILKALEAMGPVSAGGWGEYRYGPVATREPARINTIFRAQPGGPFGFAVEASGVSLPAAQQFQFVAK